MPQPARKSNKLESLPKDLRAEADELLAAKFPEPEILDAEKKSDNLYSDDWVRQRFVDYDFSRHQYFERFYECSFEGTINQDGADALAALLYSHTNSPSQVSQHHDADKCNSIDHYSVAQLQQLAKASDEILIVTHWTLHPRGEMQSLGDPAILRDLIFREHEISLVVGGSYVTKLAERLFDRMKELQNFYGCVWAASMKSYDIEYSRYSPFASFNKYNV